MLKNFGRGTGRGIWSVEAYQFAPVLLDLSVLLLKVLLRLSAQGDN
jgi:hypothetical protein